MGVEFGSGVMYFCLRDVIRTNSLICNLDKHSYIENRQTQRGTKQGRKDKGWIYEETC